MVRSKALEFNIKGHLRNFAQDDRSLISAAWMWRVRVAVYIQQRASLHDVRVYDMQLKVQRTLWVWRGDVITDSLERCFFKEKQRSRSHKNIPSLVSDERRSGDPAFSSQSFLKKLLKIIEHPHVV